MTNQKSHSMRSKGFISLILMVIITLAVLYFGLRYKEDIKNFSNKVKDTFTRISVVLHTGRSSYTKALDTLKSFLNVLPQGNKEQIQKYLTQEALKDKTWFEPWTILDTKIGKLNPLGPQNLEVETTITSKTEKGSPIHLDLNFELVQEGGQWKIAGKAERK